MDVRVQQRGNVHALVRRRVCGRHLRGGQHRGRRLEIGLQGSGCAFDQVFDLSGNVAEWVDECETDMYNQLPFCRVRGASWDWWDRPCSDDLMPIMLTATMSRGFRCCGD
jgi:hypothetical protein